MEFFLTPVGILIIINTLTFLLPSFVDFSSRGYSSVENFLRLGWKDNTDIKDGQYYRLLTSTFLHGDVIHLISNMWALFALGTAFSINFPLLFIIVYFVSGIAGSLSSFFFNPSPSVGASGSIFGLIGFILSQAVLNPDVGNLSSLIMYIVISFVISNLPGSRIDNYGHLGGLVSGLIIGFLITLL
jgi:rhomboid protease GluP